MKNEISLTRTGEKGQKEQYEMNNIWRHEKSQAEEETKAPVEEKSEKGKRYNK
jgi:hypothetical protein